MAGDYIQSHRKYNRNIRRYQKRILGKDKTMFFNISIKIAIVVNIIAIISHVAVCFTDTTSNRSGQFREITRQCRWIGLLYFIFAWFMGDGSLVSSGRTTYEQVAFWMLVASIGWLIVFAVTLLSKFCGKEDVLGSKALMMGVVYFLLAYLLH